MEDSSDLENTIYFCNYFYHNLSEGRVNMSYMLSKNIDDIDNFHIMDELQDSSTSQVYISFIILYYVFFLVGIPGNMFVFGMVKYKPLNPQNAFLLMNLSVSSLILLTSLPIKIALINSNESFTKAETGFYAFLIVFTKLMRSSKLVPRFLWPVKTSLCKFYLGCPVLCLMASLLTIAAVAADRFLAVRTTKNIILRQKRASWFAALSAIIWVISLLMTIPIFFFSSIEGEKCQTTWLLETRDDCNELIVNSTASHAFLKKIQNTTSNSCEAKYSNIEKLYSVLSLGGFILLPMLSVPLLYYCFFSRFKEHTMELDDLSEYKASNCKSKIAEVKRNVIALSISVTFTWAPFLVFHLIRFVGPVGFYQIDPSTCELFGKVTGLLLYLSCFVNPLLYTCFGSSMRKKLGRIMRRSFSQSNPTSSNISSPRPASALNFESIRLSKGAKKEKRKTKDTSGRRLTRGSWNNQTISFSESSVNESEM